MRISSFSVAYYSFATSGDGPAFQIYNRPIMPKLPPSCFFPLICTKKFRFHFSNRGLPAHRFAAPGGYKFLGRLAVANRTSWSATSAGVRRKNTRGKRGVHIRSDQRGQFRDKREFGPSCLRYQYRKIPPVLQRETRDTGEFIFWPEECFSVPEPA